MQQVQFVLDALVALACSLWRTLSLRLALCRNLLVAIVLIALINVQFSAVAPPGILPSAHAQQERSIQHLTSSALEPGPGGCCR